MLDLKKIFQILRSLNFLISKFTNTELTLYKIKENIFNNFEKFHKDYYFELFDNGDNFDVEYNIFYTKDIIINVDINFKISNGFGGFKYNNIMLVSSHGVILKDITELLKIN